MTRDKSRDGIKNQLRHWLLTSGKPVWTVLNNSGPIHEWLNRKLLDNAILMARTRPHPFSTMSDYTSLDSLRDRTYFSRHLPAERAPRDLPSVDDVTALFRRPRSARLSAKSTLLFASFAQWFTDGFLLTGHVDPATGQIDRNLPEDEHRRRTHSTHDIDLAQLYGVNAKVTAALRLLSEKRGERGCLKSQRLDDGEYPPFLYDRDDTEKPKAEFAALPIPTHLHLQPERKKRATLFAFGGERSNSTAQTAMLNVLMLREHNRLAGEIEAANPAWDDERVFQTARNTLIVLVLKIVIGEYINHISPYHHRFELDPRGGWRAHWNRPPWFAVELNMLYRWHSAIPDAIDWGRVQYPTVKWLLDNQPLIDVGLAHAFEYSSRQPAGEICLGNTPEALLHTERNAIEQGRKNRVAAYNDYREAVGYPRLTKFEQISSSPQLVESLRRLYRHVDNIEFYVGLFAEDPRPNAAVPSLLGRLVALDAFSQALLSPLCSEHVFNPTTFSEVGWRTIQTTECLADLVARNVPDGANVLVTMTQRQAKLESSAGIEYEMAAE